MISFSQNEKTYKKKQKKKNKSLIRRTFNVVNWELESHVVETIQAYDTFHRAHV